jgi:hypothetical protein
VVAVSAPGEQSQVGVGGFGSGVGQGVFDGVEDQVSVAGDGFGESGEGGDAASAGPGDPAGEQGFGLGQVGLEDHEELFFEEVGAVERAVVLGDGGQGGALVAGELGWVFQQRPPGFLDRGGLVGASSATQLGG